MGEPKPTGRLLCSVKQASPRKSDPAWSHPRVELKEVETEKEARRTAAAEGCGWGARDRMPGGDAQEGKEVGQRASSFSQSQADGAVISQLAW